MRHIIDAIAAQGRHGDDELLHVTKGEVAGLDALAKAHFGKELPRNPRTGIKEASLFQDWFGQDVGTFLGAVAPIALGFIPGIGVPAAIAAGAAMGAANQGLGKGGTTEGALLGGVMGGIAGYGGAGIAESLAAASTAAPGAIATTGAEAGGSSLAGAGGTNIAGVGANAAQPIAGTTTATMPGTATIGANGVSAATGTTGSTGAGVTELLGSSGSTIPGVTSGTAATTLPGATTPLNTTVEPTLTAGQKMASGFENITKSPQALGSFIKNNASTAMQAGIGGYGSAVNMSQPEPIAIPGQEKSTENPYQAEYYQGPGGEIRTRAVRRAAQGGLMGFADYDAADAQADGGYAPGGMAGYAMGGIANISAAKGRYLQGPGDGMSAQSMAL